MSGKCPVYDIVSDVEPYYYKYMRYVYYNPNPERSDAIDCVVRAICKVTGQTWREVFRKIADEGEAVYDMPSSNHVWGGYLRKIGFRRFGLPDSCPDCYTVAQFALDHPDGIYILAAGAHVVALVFGTYYDTWNCGDRVVDFYWYKEV